MTQRTRISTVAVLAASLLAAMPASAKEYEWTGEGWAPAAAPAEGTARGELALIRDFVENGQPGKAVKAAETFLERYPNHPACEEVMMRAGQAEFQRERYYQAFEWFEKQLARYPAGVYFDQSLEKEYEIADAFLSGKRRKIGPLRLEATGEALEILRRVAEHAPGSELARKALLRIGDHHYERKEWDRAVEAYDQFLQLHGKSARAAYATLRAARATLYSFKGIEYDITPLLEAEQRFLHVQERFPAAAREEKVEQILEKIKDSKAHKRYATGQFYQRTGRPEAARAAYERLTEDFPQTNWAQRARERLEQWGDETYESPNPIRTFGSWLWRWRSQEPSAPAERATPQTQHAKEGDEKP